MMPSAANCGRRAPIGGHRWGRVITLVLLIQVSALGLSGVRIALGGAPCPPVPSPPAGSCNAAPDVPCLPNTGGGGCAIDPTSCDDPGGGAAPRPMVPRVTRYRAAASSIGDADFTANTPMFVRTAAVAPDDPPACGDPAPTPVPLIPVCAECEAPGVASSVEMPRVRVRTNPDIGLVNVPTWLWAEGYRGQDLFASRSWSPPFEPTTIEVRYSLKRYLWNFGDGGQIESQSLGQPYPQESGIRNAYGWSSRTEPGGLFHLSLTIEWNVEYRVNGGAPQPLPPAQRRYEASYPVQELQPIVTGP